MIERKQPKENMNEDLKKQLIQMARQATCDTLFCENYDPDFVLEELDKAANDENGDGQVPDTLRVWEPFENHGADSMLEQVTTMMDSRENEYLMLAKFVLEQKEKQ